MALRDPKPGDGSFTSTDTVLDGDGEPAGEAAANPVSGGLSPARSAKQREASRTLIARSSWSTRGRDRRQAFPDGAPPCGRAGPGPLGRGVRNRPGADARPYCEVRDRRPRSRPKIDAASCGHCLACTVCLISGPTATGLLPLDGLVAGVRPALATPRAHPSRWTASWMAWSASAPGEGVDQAEPTLRRTPGRRGARLVRRRPRR